MGKKPEKKPSKDNSHKLERTAANKKARAARLARVRARQQDFINLHGVSTKTVKNRARRARQAAVAKKYGVKTWREVQAKRAYATSFDSSVEVIKPKPVKPAELTFGDVMVALLTGKAL